MRPEVTRNHITSACGVRTLRAPVGFLARVRPLVGAQVIRAGKDLAANAASVRLEAGMKSHVAGEHVTTGEWPLADITLIALDHSTIASSRS